MVKKAAAVVGLLLLLALGYLAGYSPGTTAPILTANGQPKPGSMARLEALFFSRVPTTIRLRIR